MYTNFETMEVSPSAPPSTGLPPTYQKQGGDHHDTDDNTEHTDNNNIKLCRICLEEDLPETMIAPCKCKGGSKWVHRDCLDEWRLTQPDRAFAKCTECGFEYYLQTIYREVDSNDDTEHNNSNNDDDCCNWCFDSCGEGDHNDSRHRRRRCLFYAYVSRDVCFGTVVLQLIIAMLGSLIWALDTNQVIPQAWPVLAEHPWSMYYLLGWFCLLVLVGLYGSIVLCCNGCSLERSIPQTGPPPPPSPPPTSNSSGATIPTRGTATHGGVSSAPTNQQHAMYVDRGLLPMQGGTDHHDASSSSVEYYRRARRYRQRRHYGGGGGDRRHRGSCNNNGACCDCCFYGCYDCQPMYIYNGGNHCCCCCCDDGGSSGNGGDCCHHSNSSSTGGDCCCGGAASTGSNSGNNDCGDGAQILLPILLVVAVILAAIGFFVGIVITVIAFQRIVQRHIHLLQKRQLVQEFQVMDLSGYDMDLPIPSAPLYQDVETATTIQHPLPSAPPMAEADVMYLKKMGLIDV
jgi:RING-variant domain